MAEAAASKPASDSASCWLAAAEAAAADVDNQRPDDDEEEEEVDENDPAWRDDADPADVITASCASHPAAGNAGGAGAGSVETAAAAAAASSTSEPSINNNTGATSPPSASSTSAAARASGPAFPGLERLPLVDSRQMTVHYLGRLLVTVPREQLPDGDACVAAVRMLRHRRRRSRFRHGVAKWLRLQVRGRENRLVCTPLNNCKGTELRRALASMVCVGNVESHVCCVTGRALDSNMVECEAHVFESESPRAAHYITDELMKACSTIMDALTEYRRQQRRMRLSADAASGDAAMGSATAAAQAASTDGKPEVQAAASVESAAAPRSKMSRRAPNASDRLLYASMAILEQAVIEGVKELAMRTPQQKAEAPQNQEREDEQEQPRRRANDAAAAAPRTAHSVPLVASVEKATQQPEAGEDDSTDCHEERRSRTIAGSGADVTPSTAHVVTVVDMMEDEPTELATCTLPSNMTAGPDNTTIYVVESHI